MSDDLIHDLSDWLRAVQPYCDDLVLVGGVVPWLYRAWAKPQGQPLFTTDVVDVARLVLDRTGELAAWLERNVTDATSKTWCRKADTILRRELGAPSADGTIEVALLFRDHEPDVDAELASAVVVELLDRLRLDRR